MASHPLNYEPYPEVNPAGGPDAREQIHTDPDMFGAAIGRGLQTLGQGIEKADNEGFDVATMVAKQDDQTHANEVHSWQSDQVTSAQENFLKLRGKDADMALPDFKKTIDNIHQQARSQAGNPYTAQQIDTEGRRLTDVAYSQAARHAATQKTEWDTNTATDSAASAGSRAAIAATTSPVPYNANASVVLGLNRSDDFARSAANLKGLDGDIEAQRNRGRNVAQIIKTTTADGSQTSFTKAMEFFHSQYDKMDAGSRATIEQAMRTQAATFDGQAAVDKYTGRGPAVPAGYAQRTFQIESGGNPNATTGSYSGLGQFSKALEQRYGINDSNRNDPATQARALSMENAENHDALTRALGHEPTPADYYLAHQQGVGGAVAHLSQPNLPAWQNMASTIEGREKGQGWAKQAIWGNMTPQMKAQFPGGVETVTSGDFAKMWGQRFYNQPIEASGILPGNGTQMPGGVTPAFSVDRLQGAQEFAAATKGETITRIMNDPYLKDHPAALNAAITYANKVFEQDTASYADMERQLHVQEQQKKIVSDKAEDGYLKQIYTPALSAKPIGVSDIVNDPNLSRESKDRLIKLVGDPGEKDDKTYGAGFVKAFQMIHAPAGTEGRISDPQQLYARLGPSGDLTMAGVEKLRSEIALKKSPEGEAESAMKKTMLDFAKAQLTASDPILHIKDSKGEEQLLKFQAQFWPAYDKGRAAGKTPTQMLDPDSPDYLGKSIKQFKRSDAQLLADLTADNHDLTAPTDAKPAAAGPFDINKVTSLQDLTKAYTNGDVTPQQARAYAIAHKWVRQPAAPPVSQ